MSEQTEEPKVKEPEKKTEEPNVDGLLAELKRFGVESAEDLSGKLEAGTQAGRLAQLLGDERKKTLEYEAKLRELETARPVPKQDYMDYGEGQTIDIESAIERSVSKVINREKEQARKLQEENLKKWNFIQRDTNYNLVKDVWNAKLQDPNFVYQVQSGLVDPVQEYNNTVIGYMKTLLKQSHDTIKTMRGGPKEAPHMETGEQTPSNLVSETPGISEHEKRRKDLREKASKGQLLEEDEQLALIDSIFDPMFVEKAPRK